MNPLPHGLVHRPEIQHKNVHTVTARVMAQGVYARFSQAEQLAVCEWVQAVMPAEDGDVKITVLAATEDPEIGRRVELALSAAQCVISSGRMPLPTDLEDAISSLLAAHTAAAGAPLTSMGLLRARASVREAIARIRTIFQEEA